MDKTVAVKWMQDFDQKVEAEKDHLSELDGPIGDGDHGANLARGMAAAIEAINSTEPQSTAEVRALMDRLKLSLGSPVNIKFRAGKKVQGKIEIAFSSEAELERLIAFMDGQDNTDDTETVEFRV